MSNSTCPCLVLPRATSFPIDGLGGSYYMTQFPVPTYSNKSSLIASTISWAGIDAFSNVSVANALESAVSFGICAVTLLDVIVLTPQPKRKLPIHIFLCLALTSQILRHVGEMVIMTSSLPASSYCYLTHDVGSIELSHRFYVLTAIVQVSASAAFILVQACFYIQGRGLMTWLRIHQRIAYNTILLYLVSCGVVATCCRIGVAIMQIIDPWGSWTSRTSWNQSGYYVFNSFNRGSLITGGISIGSWSLVFFASAMSIIVNRRQILHAGGSAYDIALNLVAIFGLHSFIIPILFCIMELLPVSWAVNRLEGLTLTSVLFLLPLGSLFFSVNGNVSINPVADPPPNQPDNLERQSQKFSAGSAHRLPSMQNDDMPASLTVCAASLVMPSELSGSPAPKMQSAKKALDPFEVELALIDGLDPRDSKAGSAPSTDP